MATSANWPFASGETPDGASVLRRQTRVSASPKHRKSVPASHRHGENAPAEVLFLREPATRSERNVDMKIIGQLQNLFRIVAIVCVLSACGSSVNDVASATPESDDVALASPEADDVVFATPENEYLPVLAEVADPADGGSIGAFPNDLRVDSGELVLELTHSTGCGSFHHFALVETNVVGEYEVFHDTDNVCTEVALVSFKIAPLDLVAAADGTVTIGDHSVALPES